ncbi:MAG TPA: DUF397 domain-containing protein [Streptosporangiaceae bacterium]|nr:DUF397 domain-containing protein [Streptosporangiaceae bacterium]
MSNADLSRAVWHRSSHSGQNGNCVEVAANLPGVVAVRDSKDPEGPVLVVTREQWRGFVAELKSARA